MNAARTAPQPAPRGEAAWLVLEATTPRLAAGIWQHGAWRALATTTGEALEHLADLADQARRESALAWEELAGYWVDEGPGSVLGSRLALMTAIALRAAGPDAANLPLLTFRSLELVAHQRQATGARLPLTVVTPFRLRRWLTCTLSATGQTAWTVVEDEALPAEALLVRPRKLWRDPGLPCAEVALENAAPLFARCPLLRQPAVPDVFTPEPATYVAWSGQRHRGPAATPPP